MALLAANFTPHTQAARGTPGSSEFGFGASAYLDGPYLNEAVHLATLLELDWLAIDIPWATFMPFSNSQIQYGLLDQVMQAARDKKIPVFFRLTRPPAWALTPQGPDSVATSRFLLEIANRYNGILQAVEIFPGSNTRPGWGAVPNPSAYVQLFRTLNAQLKSARSSVVLVAAGLKPIPQVVPGESINDLVFLNDLYKHGIREGMSIVSVQLDEISGSPLSLPSGSEPRTLRHYEEVRQVMVANQHPQGLVWITRLSAPSGKINPADQTWQSADQQAEWLMQAYLQMRSQLYIGVAVLDSLNPATLQNQELSQRAMIQNNASYHPFYKKLRSVIAANSQNSKTNQPIGKPKEGALSKQRSIPSGKP